MRIPPNLIKSVFYIYTSEEAAKNGHDEGACGFLVTIPEGEIKEDGEVDGPVYAITNCHVIGHILTENKTPYLRINSEIGPPIIMAVPAAAWHPHPDGDDVRAALIEVDASENIYVQNIDQFITPDHLKPDNWHIGPGDQVFMVGRFVLHDGKKTNTPVVRYGNISLSAGDGEPIYNKDTGHYDEVFLIESRSVSGYSGSPVYVYIVPYDYRSKPKPESGSGFHVTGLAQPTRMFLLGINIGNTSGHKQVLIANKDGDSSPFKTDDGTTLWSEYNTGMMRIAPAWKIRELLDIEEFKMARDKKAAKHQEKANKHFELDSKREKTDVPPISREKFMGDLEKIARKIKPEKRD